ncbi:Putative FMN-dependent dehydrogenase, FMN-dependent alpha-hydroxy acid dehydrogenase, active [Septoria linicola]|uniref:FMN-dependent dehydrogenase, FMN-dependent alpha-hydroxy acid dehydrogenase, active n=1 Tax=Septoria linicola TaxID=215465 RepID=A0A9Q9EL57_9PEZI|nr:Putative FMN-dependent dehydrogenase, FMN-dependent alpha-hydroxy acid dehydrogenase, active [Septoria linicola]
MRSTITALLASAGIASAARPYLEFPDTGAAEQYGSIGTGGQLPNVSEVIGLPDFQYLAEQYMNLTAYTYYRNGAAGEWSYRNNLEAFQRVRWRPRVMTMVDNIEDSLPTTILGHNFSAPFFISPCARGGYAGEWGELGLLKGAARGNILYQVTDFPSIDKQELQDARAEGQVTFLQLYIDPSNDTATIEQVREAERLGFHAIVLTVDSAADGNRHRAARFRVGSADSAYSSITWEKYDWMRQQTELPIVPKGIQTVEDAILANQHNVPALFLSNHGGRQVDGSPSTLEVALEIHEQAPYIFDETEVWADGGVRYGGDVVKLLALGVKAVGIGRPFMFANIYGPEGDGVARAIEIMKREVAIDAANVGIGDLKKANATYLDWKKFPTWAQGS